jgi:hypothetical protein
MSKTLVGILEIGAAIAVQFVPGLGTVAGISIGLSLAASGLTTLLTATPKPSLEEVPKKSPTPVRRSGYGEGRMAPTWALYDVAPNGWAVDAYAFHDGQINKIIDRYIGDKKVTILTGGWVQELDGGAFKGNASVQVETRMGLPTETAFGSLIFNIPDHWTTLHRGDGVVTGCMLSKNVKSKNWPGIYSLGGPNQAPLSLSMERQLVYDWRDDTQSLADRTTWKYSENFILHLSDYLLMRKDTSPPRITAAMSSGDIAAARAAYQARLAAVWAMKFAPTIDMWTAAADDADLPMPLNGVQTILAGKASVGDTSVNVYSTNGLAAGISIAIAISGDNSKTETRTVTTISGPFVSFSGGGLAYEHPQGSQVTWLSDPANPATEPRYRGCVTHNLSDPHKDTITAILACGDGLLATRSDGAYTIYSGRYQAPTVSIGPRDIITWSLQEDVNEEDSVNTLKVTYVSANHDYSVVDTDDWVDVDRLAADGKEISDGLQVQSPSFSQNRRLAKRAMAKRNAPFRGQILISGRRRDVQGERYVSLDLTEAGETFFAGPAELSNGKRFIATGAYQYDFTSVDPNIDEWNPATEEGNPAPVGNRAAVVPLDTPTINSAVVEFGAQSGSDAVGAFIRLTVAGLNRDDVTWFARTRLVGAAIWGERTYSDLDAGATVQIDTEFVPVSASVEVEVSYQTGDGRVSDWSATTTVDTATDLTAPDAATDISLDSWGATMELSTPLIARATAYRWRFYKADGTTFIATYDTTARSFSYSASQAALDGVQRSYVVKAAGVNGAGEGTGFVTPSPLTNAAPPALTSPAIAGGTDTATATADASTDTDVTGYAVYYGGTTGFDPLTTGGVVTSGTPSIPIYGLAAATWYGHLAAYDSWSANPSLLNLSTELSFVISAGGGSTPSGGGSDGGGYHGGGGGGHGAIP